MPNLHRVTTWGRIPVRAHYTWLIVTLLALIALPREVFPAFLPDLGRLAGLILSVVVVAFYAVAVIIHVLAQMLVARAFHVRFPVLNFYPFGALTRMPDRNAGPKAAFAIAAAGPIASLVMWWLLNLLATSGALPFLWLAVALFITAQLSFYLGVLNLLPGLPLDGGRMLRAVLWIANGSFESATRIAHTLGQIVAYGMIILGALALATDASMLRAIGLILAGWAIRDASGTTYRRALVARLFNRLHAGDVMQAAQHTTSPEQMLQQFALGLRGRTGQQPTPVIAADGTLVGLIDRPQLADVPQGYWEERTVGEAMTPVEALNMIAPEMSLSALIPQLMTAGQGTGGAQEKTLLVADNGHLAGLIDADELLDLLELEDEFGLFSLPGYDGQQTGLAGLGRNMRARLSRIKLPGRRAVEHK